MSLDAFKESLVEELGNKVAFTVPVLGGVPVAESVVVTWIVMAALIALALALTRRLSVDRPGKVQCALEWTVEFLNGFVKTNIGAHWRPFAPWLGTVALYIGLSNLIGVFGLTPPTKDISVTAALALMSMFLTGTNLFPITTRLPYTYSYKQAIRPKIAPKACAYI